MKKRNNIVVMLLLFFSFIVVSIPSVFAQSFLSNLGSQNFLNAFTFIGQFLEQILRNEYIVFAFSVVFFTLMLYNIFVPLIAKIPVFKADGEGTKELANKYGRIVSLCLAMLSSLGTFSMVFFGGGGFGGVFTLRESLTHFLGPYSILAGIIMALLVFALVYFGYGSCDQDTRWKNAMWGVGTALVFYGWIMNHPSIFSIGWLIVFIMLLFLMFRKIGSGGTGGGAGAGSGANKSASNDPAKRDGSKDGNDGKSGKSGEDDSDKSEGSAVLSGKIVDASGNPAAGIKVSAIDATGAEHGSAKSVGNGTFSIKIPKVTDKVITVFDVIGDGKSHWNAYNGAHYFKGAKPPFKIKKNKEQKDIVVSPGSEMGDPDSVGPFSWYPVIDEGASNPARGHIHVP